jgi:hypothetical protein
LKQEKRVVMSVYKIKQIMLLGLLSFGSVSVFGEIVAVSTNTDLTTPPSVDAFKVAKEEAITLMAQPMAAPRPKETTTPALQVSAMYNKSRIAFLLRWKTPKQSAGGRLGTHSDAVAIQFPVKDNANPPPVFMGAKSNPVHIFHWRAQYQLDKDKGMPSVKDLYPNMSVDIYPMEFKDMGSLGPVDSNKNEIYSFGKAAGNPQSYKKKGVDEIIAEGFGTSAVVENIQAESTAVWENGEWKVVIVRPLKHEGGSQLAVGGSSFMAFAVWQGSQNEVGSRKSVTMSWTGLKLL